AWATLCAGTPSPFARTASGSSFRPRGATGTPSTSPGSKTTVTRSDCPGDRTIIQRSRVTRLSTTTCGSGDHRDGRGDGRPFYRRGEITTAKGRDYAPMGHNSHNSHNSHYRSEVVIPKCLTP